MFVYGSVRCRTNFRMAMVASFAVAVLLLVQCCVALSDGDGVVALDTGSFHKIVDGHRPVLLKVDEMFSNKTVVLRRLSDQLLSTRSRLLLAQLDLSDSDIIGDVGNSELAESLGVKKLPSLLLFEQGFANINEYASYDVGRERDLKALMFWLQTQTSVHIGKDGTLKCFDALAVKFKRVPEENKDEQQKILQEAQTMLAAYEAHDAGAEGAVLPECAPLDSEGDVGGAKFYVYVMKKCIEDGADFIWREKRRLERMLSTTITDTKKKMFEDRTNILLSFDLGGGTKRERIRAV